MPEQELFDEWPDRYEEWFRSPIGSLIREYEGKSAIDMLDPQKGEAILDAGCGTGIFTMDYLRAGATVTGLDISEPMLELAVKKTAAFSFSAVRGDMLALPFGDESFDKTISITAIEFIEDGQTAVDELFRVTRSGGTVVVATLNRLSPWAAWRDDKAEKGEEYILKDAFYRSPQDLLSLSKVPGAAKTVIHFMEDRTPEEAAEIEQKGNEQKLDTGAFLVAAWRKP